MTTAIKCDARGVVIAGRPDFFTALGDGLTIWASRVVSPRPTVETAFPNAFAVRVGSADAIGWIDHIEHAGNSTTWMRLKIRFQVESEVGDRTTTVQVNFNFHGTDHEAEVFETTWHDDVECEG